MFSLPPGSDLNQNRGPITSLKEEPLGARAWMQPTDQIKWEPIRYFAENLWNWTKRDNETQKYSIQINKMQ